MNGMVEEFLNYWQYPFVRYALAVGVMIALASSLLGVVLVVRHFSFIGDGLSHVAFGAMAIATALAFEETTPFTLLLTVLFAVLILGTGQQAKIKGDSVIAMASVGSMAIGYLLMNLFPSSSNLSGDVCSSLFGSTSILTLSEADVRLCFILSSLVLLLFLFFYPRIFAVSFDAGFAQAVGSPVRLYNLGLGLISALIIVLAMKLVGSLLTSALLIFPALSSMRLFKSFRAVTLCSAFLSISCTFIGIVVSILAATPVGSTIVVVDILAFLLFSLLGRLTGRAR